MASGGFSQSGRAQSQQFAWQACTICRAPIRVSYFLVGCFLLQLGSAVQGGADAWVVALVGGQQAILVLTVLCHEFGHGKAARALGGEIDHILLWPFGGICFSTRPQEVAHGTMLRNELWIVLAGPATHLLMTPAWALLLHLLGQLLASRCAPAACTSCTGLDCVWVFLNPMGPVPSALSSHGAAVMGDVVAVLWTLLGLGIRMNVGLFLFNVFFPMYPADGSKILTVSLMHCCGASPRLAATVLICCSSVCATLLILYAVWCLEVGGFHGGVGSMMSGLMGWMGVMSLIEAYQLYELRQQQKLHQHPLFSTARSTVVTRQDAHGVFQQLNATDLDDPAPPPARAGPQAVEPDASCCLCAGPGGPESSDEDETELSSLPPARLEAQGEQRMRREDFLHGVERQQADRQRPLRQPGGSRR